MNREIPTSSRLVTFQQLRRNWIKHQDRIITCKPTISSRPFHNHIPTTRRVNFNESLAIQLQNKSLLKKLTERSNHKLSTSRVGSSLAPSFRKKYYEQHRIRIENEGLLRRLKQSKPMIGTDKLREERKETQKYINTISRFNYKSYRPNKTVMKFDMPNNQLKYQMKNMPSSQLKQLSKSQIKQLSSRRQIQQNKIVDQNSLNIQNIQKNSNFQHNSKSLEAKNTNFDVKNRKMVKNSQNSRSAAFLDYDHATRVQKNKKSDNQDLLNYYSKRRPYAIEGIEVQLKISMQAQHIVLEIAQIDKENSVDDLQVEIPHALFEAQFQGNIRLLLGRLRYNRSYKVFYIQ